MLADSNLAWSLVWFALFLAFIALLIVLAWALYKMGKRRTSPGWWIAAILGIVSLVVLPVVGFVVAGLILFVDRNST